jgi:hypothetical protein
MPPKGTSDAPTLPPGTYSVAIRVGEEVEFTVPASGIVTPKNDDERTALRILGAYPAGDAKDTPKAEEAD